MQPSKTGSLPCPHTRHSPPHSSPPPYPRPPLPFPSNTDSVAIHQFTPPPSLSQPRTHTHRNHPTLSQITPTSHHNHGHTLYRGNKSRPLDPSPFCSLAPLALTLLLRSLFKTNQRKRRLSLPPREQSKAKKYSPAGKFDPIECPSHSPLRFFITHHIRSVFSPSRFYLSLPHQNLQRQSVSYVFFETRKTLIEHTSTAVALCFPSAPLPQNQITDHQRQKVRASRCIVTPHTDIQTHTHTQKPRLTLYSLTHS